MTKGLKITAICLVVVVVAVTLFKGIPAIVTYIESKAVADVSNRQLEDSIKVQTEASQTVVDFNRELTQELTTSSDFFEEMDARVDLLIKQRESEARANAVELPDTHVTASVKSSASVPTTKPIEAVTGDEELAIAWEAFCKLRPSYKDCAQGARP